MKTSTFKNRVSKSNSGTKGKEVALNLLTGVSKVRSCWTSGSGRFCKNMDYTEDAINALHHAGLKQNVDFILENDSPRGGETGNCLVLTSKGKRKIIKN